MQADSTADDRGADGPTCDGDPPQARCSVIRCRACPYTRVVTAGLLERVADGLSTRPSARLREQVLAALTKMRCPHCGSDDARWIDVAARTPRRA